MRVYKLLGNRVRIGRDDFGYGLRLGRPGGPVVMIINIDTRFGWNAFELRVGHVTVGGQVQL